jgi:hypothetical protein
MLEDGKSPKKELLVDLIGNFARSAREGLPIYRIGGGAGLIWIAGFDLMNGRGTLRFLAVDASELASSGQAAPASRAAPQPARTQPASEEATEEQAGQAALQRMVERLKADLAISTQRIAELETAKADTGREIKEVAKPRVAGENANAGIARPVDTKPTASIVQSQVHKARADPGALAWKVFALVAFLTSIVVFLIMNRSRMRVAARYPI